MTGLWLIVLLRFGLLLLSVLYTGRAEAGPDALRLSPTSGLLNATLILWFLRSCISFRLLLVYLNHIWHISRQLPLWLCLCSMNSVLSSRSWLAWFFKKDAIDNAQSIASMLNEKWLQDSKNQLELGLVDIGASMKAVLASAQVATEKKKIVSIRMQTNYWPTKNGAE